MIQPRLSRQFGSAATGKRGHFKEDYLRVPLYLMEFISSITLMGDPPHGDPPRLLLNAGSAKQRTMHCRAPTVGDNSNSARGSDLLEWCYGRHQPCAVVGAG